MKYIGIDVGAKGGIAVLYENEIEVYPYSDETLIEVCKNAPSSATMCFVEKVGAMPNQGVTSMFRFGQSFGFILGVLSAFGIPFQLVPPRKWKAHFSLDGEKAKSIETAKRLFPSVSLLPTSRCKKDSDGMAESLLIALYGKRTDGGER